LFFCNSISLLDYYKIILKDTIFIKYDLMDIFDLWKENDKNLLRKEKIFMVKQNGTS